MPETTFAGPSDALPKNLVTPEEWAALTPWFHEIDLERFADECRRLNQTPYGRELIFAVGHIATVEDRTPDYLTFIERTRGYEDMPSRKSYSEGIWVPEELTHGTLGHVTVDFATRAEVTGRHARNEAAVATYGLKSRAKDWATKQVVSRLWPGEYTGTVDGKGMINESVAEFIYWAIVEATHRDYPILAEAFSHPRAEEPQHRKQYADRLAGDLADLPRQREKVVERVAGQTAAVGDDILSLATQVRILTTLTDPEFVKPEKLARFVARRDGFISTVLGMEITPIHDTFANVRRKRMAS